MKLYKCIECGTLRYTESWPELCSCDGNHKRVKLAHDVLDAGALTGSTIREHIEDGNIGIDPEPQSEQYQPASLDVRIGSGLYDAVADEVINEPGSGDEVTVHPGRFYLGHSLDRITMPDYMIAFLQGRSTMGRDGIVIHKTAGVIDPGFEGQVTLEIYNFGRDAVTFEPGDRVGQLVFVYTNKWSAGYDGSYQGQTGPTPSR